MKLFALKCGSARWEGKDFPDSVDRALEHGLDAEVELRPLCDRFADERIHARLVANGHLIPDDVLGIPPLPLDHFQMPDGFHVLGATHCFF